MGKTYFTACPHFGHTNILHLGKGRPFTSIKEHDETIINNWNSAVKPEDTIYVLGDFQFKGFNRDIKDLLSKLNGNKHLILGNHDNFSEHRDAGWISIKDYKRTKLKLNSGEELNVVMFHYPILEFDGAWKDNTVHLFGHVHENSPEYQELIQGLGFKAYNVDLATNGFYPIDLETIWSKVKHIKKKG